MDPIGMATLLLPPRPVAWLANRSPLWMGDAAADGGTVRLYLKQAPPEEMLAEFLCYWIGTALALPIPRAYLVQDPGRLAGGGLLVGSADAGMASLRQFVEAGRADLGRDLGAWTQLPDAARFDEWIANPDRNQGNLLWDGAGLWALIDHARALGAWPPGAPVPAPDAATDNALARVVGALLGEVGLMRLRKQCDAFTASCRSLDLGGLASVTPARRLGMVTRQADALSFLASRIERLPGLLARHGPQAELPL